MEKEYGERKIRSKLYLKSLLFAQNIDCRREHVLFKPYKSLPEKMQEQLKDLHPCGNIPKENFELELREIRKIIY
ncbi:MAG: hypothetical protein Q4C57_00015 [Bacillota bacterium]|nr:hypothetical protein [Bacillota bacterium]